MGVTSMRKRALILIGCILIVFSGCADMFTSSVNGVNVSVATDEDMPIPFSAVLSFAGALQNPSCISVKKPENLVFSKCLFIGSASGDLVSDEYKSWVTGEIGTEKAFFVGKDSAEACLLNVGCGVLKGGASGPLVEGKFKGSLTVKGDLGSFSQVIINADMVETAPGSLVFELIGTVSSENIVSYK